MVVTRWLLRENGGPAGGPVAISNHSPVRSGKPRSARRGLRTFIGGAVVALVSATTAQADVCSALRAQMGGGGGGAEAAALARQYSALQALQRKRRCTGKPGGGFFDPCAEVAARIAAVQQKMSRVRGGNATVIKARLDAAGCTTKGRSSERRTSASDQRRSGPSFGRNDMLFCVREADGYFFPVPSSQFATGKDYKQIVDQCQYICKSPEMSVYRLDDPSLETDQMVSVETGTTYNSLATAFAYRESAGFEGCDFQSYYRRVEEARARTVTPYDMKNAVVPVPRQRPEDGPTLVTQADATAKEPELRELSYDANRTVRVVGPNFFPN
jgi:hypothetical protein